MKLASIETLVVRTPPEETVTSGRPASYPGAFEAALVNITTDTGLSGWGEAQCTTAPGVVCEISHALFKPALEGSVFRGTREEIESIREELYSTVRFQGEAGGFTWEAISAVDVALWDLAGQARGVPISALIGGEQATSEVAAYVTGLGCSDLPSTVRCAADFHKRDFRRFEISHDCSQDHLLGTLDALRTMLGTSSHLAVDACWRLRPDTAIEFGRRLDERGVLWLKNPLPPEYPLAHAQLAKAIRTPIALGETCHTRHEVSTFFRKKALSVVQLDLGRCGITEGLRIAQMAEDHHVKVVIRVGASVGPLLLAAIQFAAGLAEHNLVEYNPTVLARASQFLAVAPLVRDGGYVVPTRPGLGMEVEVPEVRLMEERGL